MMTPSADGPVQLIVLTGFLGSGKTSLLVDFLKTEEAQKTGVIVNEVGAIGIDDRIVHQESGATPYSLLDNGCVCCSLGGSLAGTVEGMVMSTPGGSHLKRVIIETSGISHPGPVVASLANLPFATSVEIVTILDVTRDVGDLLAFDEGAAQLAAAHRIVLTKLDLVDADRVQATRLVGLEVNPFAHILVEAERRRRAVRALGGASWMPPMPTGLGSATGIATHPRLHVISGRTGERVRWSTFAEWTDNLAALCGRSLLRFKALVSIEECTEPVLLQSVGSAFCAPRRMSACLHSETATVIITRDIGLAEIAAVGPALPWAAPLHYREPVGTTARKFDATEC